MCIASIRLLNTSRKLLVITFITYSICLSVVAASQKFEYNHKNDGFYTNNQEPEQYYDYLENHGDVLLTDIFSQLNQPIAHVDTILPYSHGNNNNGHQKAMAEVTTQKPLKQIDRTSMLMMHKRGCVPRNGGCDHRPNDCCFNTSCRCNLWGSNCRCQRMGLFQKWG